MENDKRNKSLRKGLKACLIVSALFVVGIPMIPFGIGHHWLWMWIPGILFTGGGFFATPILWTFWGVAVGQRRLCLAIEEDGILAIDDLARNFGRRPRLMRMEVSALMNKRWLTGYKFNADKTALIAVEQKKPRIAARCPSCSAPVPKDAAVCPYCGVALR
jgi:hypothetical protein